MDSRPHWLAPLLTELGPTDVTVYMCLHSVARNGGSEVDALKAACKALLQENRSLFRSYVEHIERCPQVVPMGGGST